MYRERYGGPGRGVAIALILAGSLAAIAGCKNDPLRRDVALVDGKESVYRSLSRGTPATAKGLLSDEWNLGPRFPVVRIAPITWTEDPFGDPHWRFLFYSLRPTAHLLWAYETSGDTRYRDKLLSILDGFARHDEAHPGELDPATFGDAHGAGYRALVLVNSYRKLERTGDLPADVAARLRASLARLGAFLVDPGHYEGDQSHGLTEAAGLAAIGANFPELPGAEGFLALALARLDAFMRAVVDADGVEVENSPSSHFHVLGLGAELERWALANGVALPAGFSPRRGAMLDYAAYIVQPDGGVPHLGASVDLDAEDLSPAIYAPLADESPEFAWAYTHGARGAPPQARARLFPVSGQAMLRSPPGAAADLSAQTFVTLNVGPWRSTHNHRDVLGLTLYGAGAVLLPDSGLYTYAPGDDRDYFMGSRAHNVVVVDGRDQDRTGPVTPGLTASGPSWAYQSGAHGLYAGVTVRRGVLVLRRDLVLVLDRVEGASPHAVAQTWQLPATLSHAASGLAVDAKDAAGVTRLAIRQGLEAGVRLAAVRGATAPLQGWVSDRYGAREPTWTLAFEATAASPSFVTLLASGDLARQAPRVSVATAGAETIATVCAGAAQLEARIADLAGPAERVVVSVAAEGGCP